MEHVRTTHTDPDTINDRPIIEVKQHRRYHDSLAQDFAMPLPWIA